MLNVDGNIRDREVFCPAPAWESCPSGGWRKNLRDNTFTEVSRRCRDLNEQVDEDCDGVDLTLRLSVRMGRLLGCDRPHCSGHLYAGRGRTSRHPPTTTSTTAQWTTATTTVTAKSAKIVVDGKDDDADGASDEDWWGGNSEPETKFIQDMTEMNDDTGEQAAWNSSPSLTHHSYSELDSVAAWGHCTDCESPDHAQLPLPRPNDGRA